MSQNQFWNLFAKKLAGEANDEELDELEKLFKIHSGLSYAAQHIEDLWKLESTDDLYLSEQAYQKHIQSLMQHGILLEDQVINAGINDKKQKNKLKAISWVLIFIVLTAIVLIPILFPIKHSNLNRIKNPNKLVSVIDNSKAVSKIRVVLPDSSIVWLNSGSTLAYENQFGISTRNVNLTGEAFFEVSHRPIPFIIHTQSIQIKVLGTEFNVRSYPSEKSTETSLIRGKVEITLDKRPEQTFILKPNEKLVVKNDINGLKNSMKEVSMPIFQLKQLTKTDDSTIAETSWVYNKLVFQNESFLDLATKMERWYGTKIIFKDKELEALHFTGIFQKEGIETALEALKITGNFNYHIKNNIITISKIK